MKTCSTCKIEIDYYYNFYVYKDSGHVLLCYECHQKDNDHDPALTVRCLDEICVYKNCLNIQEDMLAYCPIHAQECSKPFEVCRRCYTESWCINKLCSYCHYAEASRDFRDYRRLGDPEELKRELEDYRSLGSYNQLADLVSRAEIMDHCDELNI